MANIQASQEFYKINPQDAYQLDGLWGDLGRQTSAFQGYANNAANAFNTNFQQYQPLAHSLNANFSQFAPSLNTEFKGPQFNNSLDAFSHNILAQGAHENAQRLAAQQGQIAGSVRNQGAARILQAQAAAQSMLGQNPQLWNAALAQRAREGQEFQLGQQSQALTNAARLSQGQEQARLQALGNDTLLKKLEQLSGLQSMQNAAEGQKLQIQATPLTAQQNLMQVLGQMIQLRSPKVAEQSSDGVFGGNVGYKNPGPMVVTNNPNNAPKPDPWGWYK